MILVQKKASELWYNMLLSMNLRLSNQQLHRCASIPSHGAAVRGSSSEASCKYTETVNTSKHLSEVNYYIVLRKSLRSWSFQFSRALST